MKERLTRETALNLHRRMWADMLIKLGNNPDGLARTMFKLNWIRTHGYEDVECNCFLCEYDFQQRKVLEKGWFSRGTKIMVTGYRRENSFIAKTYKATPTHQLYRIININDKDITLEHERITVNGEN